MYNLDLIKTYREQWLSEPMPFLEKYREDIAKANPYQGLSILHNVPLTIATVYKIEALALGGAKVSIISPKNFPMEEKAVEILNAAGFEINTSREFKQSFDLHLDCCAELLDILPPNIGAVELTQSGSKIYQHASIDYPIISVDDSKLKVLETFFGTGDGFARALDELVGDKKQHKSFVIFGNGKVGRVILHAIKKFSYNITVIDLKDKFTHPKDRINYIDAKDIQKVKDAIKNSFCVITATGIKNLLSDYYSLTKSDCRDAILVNMGADDEYGHNFLTSDVMFNKKPFNFSLREPTAFRYLDPIFYAHNISIDILLSKNANKAYNAFPDKTASDILNKWHSIYNEDLEEALSN
jgi:adenosylhomocysteinase